MENNKKIKLWTRQHKNVYNIIKNTGRFVVSSNEYICFDMPEHKDIILFSYDWLQKNCPKQDIRPKDAKYHIWTSFSKDASYLGDENSVLIELLVSTEDIIKINVAKWTNVLDYQYIPSDEKDRKRHNKTMKDLGLYDTKVVMSDFYPDLKKEIVNSWKRVFDENINFVNDICYGLLWEIKNEWVVSVV